LEVGVYSSVIEIADAEKISKSYVIRILRLALLAPGIVEAIFSGGRSSGKRSFFLTLRSACRAGEGCWLVPGLLLRA
jgi:hypothetical protein